jgi:CheY-like chemotaxis protein
MGIMQLPVVAFFSGQEQPSPWLRQKGGFGLREARSTEALLACTSFFLHRGPASMSDAERQAVDAMHGRYRSLEGKKALIVDDDMRNIFALATVLDEEGMVIVSADNGRDAIAVVEMDPAIDIVLMDIMMPEMDGLTTMQEIRKLPRGKELPMVAVTAKAMKGDRQKCIEAGAWDYLSKPVDPTHLLSVLRGWLCR